MPNRILREGILTSERVDSLNWEAEVFYRRLMSVVDDFGRFTANPKLLRAALYPLKLDAVRDANMERLLACVEQARLVRVYEVAGKRYLEMLDFKQQIRSKESKYPSPESGMRSNCVADDSQTIAPAHLDVSVSGDVSGDESGARAPVPEADKPQPPSPPPQGNEYGRVSALLRKAGIQDAHPGHQTFRQLVDAGISDDEWYAAAASTLQKGKGFTYLLGVVEGRRKDAAKVDVPAMQADQEPWHQQGRKVVEAKAAEVGIKAWDECEQWGVYLLRVREAVDAREVA